ncbi:MAG: hypothetical protein ACYDCL_22100 [Myxococcales bacterium]
MKRQSPWPRRRLVLALCLVAPTTLGTAARASEPAASSTEPASQDPRLGLLAGAVGIGGPGAYGAALGAGLRLRLGSYFAASVDLGYGLAGAASGMQDRWWLFPAVAGIIPAGRLRLDLGAGFGVATSSGYVSWSDYAAGPFMPIWHFTVPAVRVHLAAAYPVANGLDLYARLEAVSLLLTGAPHGDAELANTLWFGLWLGIQVRLL